MFGWVKKSSYEKDMIAFSNVYSGIQADIKAILSRLDVLEGKRKKEIDELFNVDNSDPDFNRVNVNYTKDDEREYELREKWDKNGDLTDDEKKEWDRINEKYNRHHEPFLTQAERDAFYKMDSKAKAGFISEKFFSDKKK